MSNEEYLPPDSETTTELTPAAPSTLEVITKSEYAAMVATANLAANKRKIDVFSKQLMAYATHSQPVALSMFYTLPRAGKQIVGPGVRFAEIVAPCWRNNSTGSRMIGSTDDTVTAQGVFIDYEFNNRNVKEIPRSIRNKDGVKFNADMVLTTGKAALSIAYREAVLKGGVPMALWDPAYQQAKLTAVGQAKSHSERVEAAMEYLTKLKVTEWQIFNAIGVSSPNEIEIDHLVTLKTLCEEIKKGARTIEEVFGSPFDKEIEALFTQLGKNETEKRLLRNSYMGRAKDLVEYLRTKTPTQPSKPADSQPKAQPPQETKQAEPSTEAKNEQATQAPSTQPAGEPVRRGRGRPKGSTTKQHTAQQETTEQTEVESEPDGSEGSDQGDGEQQGNSEPAAEPEHTEVPETGKFTF